MKKNVIWYGHADAMGDDVVSVVGNSREDCEARLIQRVRAWRAENPTGKLSDAYVNTKVPDADFGREFDARGIVTEKTAGRLLADLAKVTRMIGNDTAPGLDDVRKALKLAVSKLESLS